MVWYGPTSETVIGVARGETKEPWPPIFLENIVILCFERRFSIQNSVIRLKSNILPPSIFGLATLVETVSMQRRQKIWLKYTDFTELKNITSRI